MCKHILVLYDLHKLCIYVPIFNMRELKLREFRGAYPKSQLGSQDTHGCMKDDICNQVFVFVCTCMPSAWDWWSIGTTKASMTFLTAALTTGLGA